MRSVRRPPGGGIRNLASDLPDQKPGSAHRDRATLRHHGAARRSGHAVHVRG
ncbi:hypothetical protein OG927_32470 [Streptomyces clavifer]|uniref:hypothetical protein n=1 Tax=Streptomyces clavifer TaxID=68188 RepID=UPI000B23DB72|nr:hypothetical protein [Streptomyces clavifer]WUC31766.1 hypothetical protein OG927_32470 [Streptomyces clavifer]